MTRLPSARIAWACSARTWPVDVAGCVRLMMPFVPSACAGYGIGLSERWCALLDARNAKRRPRQGRRFVVGPSGGSDCAAILLVERLGQDSNEPACTGVFEFAALDHVVDGVTRDLQKSANFRHRVANSPALILGAALSPLFDARHGRDPGSTFANHSMPSVITVQGSSCGTMPIYAIS